MGFFDNLFGGGSGGVTATCLTCGATMKSDDGNDDRFECPNCRGVFFVENGELIDPWNRPTGSAGKCEICQSSLKGGDGSLPWEDGNNANAYIRCSSCGHENIRYGFGEDD